MFTHYQEAHEVKCEGDPPVYHYSKKKQPQIATNHSNTPAKALFTKMYKKTYAEMEQKHPGVLEPLSSLESTEAELDDSDLSAYDTEILKSAATEPALFEEVELEIANFLSLYQCHYCSVSFTTATDRSNHEKQIHENEVAECQSDFDENKKIVNAEVQCHFCKDHFETAIDRDDHEKEKHQSQAIQKILQEYNVTKYGWIRLGYAYLLKRCTICSYFTTTNCFLMEHMKFKHSIDTYYMCHTCGRLFTSEVKQKKHQEECMNHERTNKVEEVICSKCGEKYNSMRLLSIHQKFINCTDEAEFTPADFRTSECSPGETVGEVFVDDPDTWTFYCRYCVQHFEGKDLRDKHEKEHHMEETTAKLARQEEIVVKCLRKENFTVEEWETKGYGHLLQNCSECDYKAIYPRDLKKHQLNMHSQKQSAYQVGEGKSVLCDKCGKVFKNAWSAKKHREYNCTNDPNSVPGLCDKCGKVFKNTESAQKHSQNTNCTNDPNFVPHAIRKEERIPCERCGKMIAKSNLKKHNTMVNCTNDPDFVVPEESRKTFRRHRCNKCGYRFYKKQTLAYHNAKVNCDNSEDFKPVGAAVKRSKIKNIPVECTKCDKVFAHKYRLQRHNEEVNCNNDPNFVPGKVEAPPITCKRCGKAIQSKSAFRIHNAMVNCTKDPNFKITHYYQYGKYRKNKKGKQKSQKQGNVATGLSTASPSTAGFALEGIEDNSENKMHVDEWEDKTHADGGEYYVVYDGEVNGITNEDLGLSHEMKQEPSVDTGVEVTSQEGIPYAQDVQNSFLKPVLITQQTGQSSVHPREIVYQGQMSVSANADRIPKKNVDVCSTEIPTSNMATMIKPTQFIQNTPNIQPLRTASADKNSLRQTDFMSVAVKAEPSSISTMQNTAKSKYTVQNVVGAKHALQNIVGAKTGKTNSELGNTVANIVRSKYVVRPKSAIQSFVVSSDAIPTAAKPKDTVQNVVAPSSAVRNAAQPSLLKYVPLKVAGTSKPLQLRKTPEMVKTVAQVNQSPQTQNTQIGIETVCFPRAPQRVQQGTTSHHKNTSVDTVRTKTTVACTENVDAVKYQQNVDTLEYRDTVNGQSAVGYEDHLNTVGTSGPLVIEGVGELASGQQSIELVDESGQVILLKIESGKN